MAGVKSIISITSVIGYIERHLSEQLDLDIVAKAVHYSKYHLHRLFSDTVGMTIHDYIQRRRLTQAAKLLVFSGKSIMSISLLAGYQSQQAFTSVFKAMYKLTPLEFRENEVFYPLQLEYKLDVSKSMPPRNFTVEDIRFARMCDIPSWMELVRLAVDGFPCLDEAEHRAALKIAIAKRRALMLSERDIAVGAMIVSYDTGSIDFLAVHPLYRKQGLSRLFLGKAIEELISEKQISITTYREGDRADLGYRKALKELGFTEAELLTEFGYPTQKFVFPAAEQHAANAGTPPLT